MYVLLISLHFVNFNPRSREGSDKYISSGGNASTISIHAPARGATRPVWNMTCIHSLFQSTLPRGERLCSSSIIFLTQSISIHAPARGATMRHRVKCGCFRFQSTLPRGERPCSLVNVFSLSQISIHAPARGATKLQRFT